MHQKNSLEQYCEEKTLNSWDKVFDYYKKHFRKENEVWIFRGQSRKKYKTSYISHVLERKMIEFNIDFSNANKIERGLLRKFMGNLHQYESSVPDKNDILEW